MYEVRTTHKAMYDDNSSDIHVQKLDNGIQQVSELENVITLKMESKSFKLTPTSRFPS